jgi:hypothetical protein
MEALIKAVAHNEAVILEAFKDSPSMTRALIYKVCANKGYADDVSIDMAIRELVDDGSIIATNFNGVTIYTR